MNELIRVQTNDKMEPVISGRELHAFLEVGTRYDTWFERMRDYGFENGRDFIEMNEEVDAQKRARTYEQKNHALKLDMAKEISMIQRNEKGKQARQYFISIEKEFNSPEKIMARALRIADETINSLKLETKVKDQQIAELKPKADYYDDILKNKGLVTITQIAKDYGMSGQEMNRTLRDLGVQYKQSEQWLLYAKHHDKGYTHSETTPITHSDGRPDIVMTTKWRQKGRIFLYNLLKDNGILPVIERD